MIINGLGEGSYCTEVEFGHTGTGGTMLSCSRRVGYGGEILFIVRYLCEVPLINNPYKQVQKYSHFYKYYCNSTYKKACPFEDRPMQEGKKKEQNGDSTHQKHTGATWFLLKHFCTSVRFIKQQIWRNLLHGVWFLSFPFHFFCFSFLSNFLHSFIHFPSLKMIPRLQLCQSDADQT